MIRSFIADMPPWYLPSFDLRTEYHYFVQELRHRYQQSSATNNTWIIKPAIGTRSIGHYILSDSHDSMTKKSLDSMLIEAAFAAPMLQYSSIWREIVQQQVKKTKLSFDRVINIPSNDRVAQLLVMKPLLIHGLKFDLRVYAFRSILCAIRR